MHDTVQVTATVLLSILSSITFSGLLSAGIIWLTKTWISERLKAAIQDEYQQRLETHKSELKAKADVELEKLRAELGRQSSERQFKFERLNEKRAEVIAETYARLVKMKKVSSLTIEIPDLGIRVDKAERGKEIMLASNEFFDYFNGHQIYIPERAVRKIHLVLAHINMASIQSAQSPLQMPVTEGELAKVLQDFKESSKPMILAIRELEMAFRELLGEEHTSKSDSINT